MIHEPTAKNYHRCRAPVSNNKFCFVPGKSELKNIYHAIFESHLRYGCQIWFLSSSKFIRDKLEKLQKKALRIMSFSDLREKSSPLFKE